MATTFSRETLNAAANTLAQLMNAMGKVEGDTTDLRTRQANADAAGAVLLSCLNKVDSNGEKGVETFLKNIEYFCKQGKDFISFRFVKEFLDDFLSAEGAEFVYEKALRLSKAKVERMAMAQ